MKKILLFLFFIQIFSNASAKDFSGVCVDCNNKPMDKSTSDISKVVTKLQDEVTKKKLRRDLRQQFCKDIIYYYQGSSYDEDNLRSVVDSYLFKEYADYIPFYHGAIFTDEERGSFKTAKANFFNGYADYTTNKNELYYASNGTWDAALKNIETMCDIKRPEFVNRILLPGLFKK
jgi:hypothetical protein